MKEQKQKYLHAPDKDIIGDCFRTCVACVLGVDRDTVPHVYEMVKHLPEDQQTDLAIEHLNIWLDYNRYNYVYVEYPVCTDLDSLKVYISKYLKDSSVIVGCSSKNGGHAVVMKNDNYMWDPAIDNSGCVGPMKDGYFWLGLLAKR